MQEEESRDVRARQHQLIANKRMSEQKDKAKKKSKKAQKASRKKDRKHWRRDSAREQRRKVKKTNRRYHCVHNLMTSTRMTDMLRHVRLPTSRKVMTTRQ